MECVRELCATPSGQGISTPKPRNFSITAVLWALLIKKQEAEKEAKMWAEMEGIEVEL